MELARWFDMPDLVGTVDLVPSDDPRYAWPEPSVALVRTLPEDTYVPADLVVAVLTAAIWWGKPVNVSWMQMDFDPFAGCDVPTQHHRKQAAVMFIDDDLWLFGVACPEDLDGPARIATDCVTDIRLVLFPDSPTEQLPAGVQVDG